jgi:tetratricopeptide (TPR) repeat protein
MNGHWVSDELINLVEETCSKKQPLEQTFLSLNGKLEKGHIVERQLWTVHANLFANSANITNTLNLCALVTLAQLMHYYFMERVQDTSLKIQSIIVLGSAYRRIGELYKGLEFIQEAIEFTEQYNHNSLRIFSLFHLGMVYHEQGRYKRSLELFDKVLSSVSSLTPSQQGKLTVNLQGLKAQAYYELGNLDRAEQYYQRALDFSGSIGNWSDWAIWARGSALLRLESTKDSREAIRLMKQSVNHSKEVNDWVAVVEHYISLGLVYYASGQIHETLATLEEALQLSKVNGYLKGEATALSKLAQVLTAVESVQAEQKLRDALSKVEEIGLLKEKGILLLRLSELLNRREYYNESRKARFNAQSIFQEIEYTPRMIRD